jgi:peroxiredoxin
LRHQFEEFKKRKIIVLVIGPENKNSFENYFSKNNLPFIGLPDPSHSVLNLYGQQIKMLKLGRMPAQVLVDQRGIARYAHYGQDMTDIPTPTEILELIDKINQE